MIFVDLTKRPRPGSDHPGGDLLLRPDDEVEVWQPPTRRVRHLTTRVRQTVASTALVVIDQPAITRTLARGRQSPRVVKALVCRSPHGLRHLARLVHGWLVDIETLDLMASAHQAQDVVAYEKAAKAREGKNLAGRRRTAASIALLMVGLGLAWWAPAAFAGILAALVFAAVLGLAPRPGLNELVFAAIAATIAWFAGPWLAAHIPQPPTWIWWATLVIGVPVFGWLGRKRDQPLVDLPPTVADHQAPPLTAPMVTGALVSLGNAKMKEPDDIRLLMDVARHAHGYDIDLELPPGVTASWVIDQREAFAASLRRELGTVWPAVGRRHPGHLTLSVLHQPMATATQTPWPLAEPRERDIFEPQPQFTDQQGEWVNLMLAYNQMVIGGLPGYGKSFALRQLAVAVAFDPRVRLVTLDGKGNGDLRPLRPVVHGFYEGDDPDEITEQLAAVRGIREEMRRRAKFLRELPREENPMSKVTSMLADRYPHLAPIVLLVDEVQTYTEYEDKDIREEFIALFSDIVKRGRSAAIIPIFCTQKPSASVLPSAIADNCSVRLCFRVHGQRSNDQVLGNEMHSAGIKATKFSAEDKGIAYLRGDGRDPIVVRTVHGLDAVEAERLVKVARVIRERRGLLTGHAADDDTVDAVLVTNVVDDVETAMSDRNRRTAQHVELVEWLGELRAEDYEDLDVEELSARLRARGVPIRQIRSNGINRRGVRLADLRESRQDDPA